MRASDAAVFNKVAATLSFTRAGQLAGLSRSAVSKRISRLEDDLGVLLLNRSSRSITLTAAGERFYDQTIKLEETLKLANDAVKDAKDMPFGKLAFTMPTSLGASFTPLIARHFQVAWPDIDMYINFDDRYVDIIGEGFDVAIRVARQLRDSSLMTKKLLSSPEVLVASPRFLKDYGRPIRAEELANTRCLTLATNKTDWTLLGPNGPIEIQLRKVTTFSNKLTMILAAVLDGGMMLIPKILVESEIRLGRLEVISSKLSTRSEYGVFAVFPNRHPTANARIFVEFVADWLPRLGDVDRWNPLGLPKK